MREKIERVYCDVCKEKLVDDSIDMKKQVFGLLVSADEFDICESCANRLLKAVESGALLTALNYVYRREANERKRTEERDSKIPETVDGAGNNSI